MLMIELFAARKVTSPFLKRSDRPAGSTRSVAPVMVSRTAEHAEQLEFFFVANGVTDPKQKKAVLLSNLPAETYQLAKAN